MAKVYPPAHARLIVQGTLYQSDGGGQEIFEFGWADLSSDTPEALAKSCASFVGSYLSGLNNIGMSINAVANAVRVEYIGDDGKISDSYTAPCSPARGTASANVQTIQSMALTLETATEGNKGRMVRGRFYPPAYPPIAGATATLSDTQTYVQGWVQFVKGMEQAGSIPAVASITGSGQLAQVVGLSAGSVLDTQRRRRNNVTVQRTQVYSI